MGVKDDYRLQAWAAQRLAPLSASFIELTLSSKPRVIADAVIEKSYIPSVHKSLNDVTHDSGRLYSNDIRALAGMNDRQLRYACAVWREHSFSKAGTRLAVSQPSLSSQIRALEEELGFELFYRGSRGVEPSVDGLAFLQAAEQVVIEMAGLKDFGRELRGKAGPHVRIGISSGVAQAMVPQIVKGFSCLGRVYPEITTATSRRIQRLVHEQRLDIGILFENDISMRRHNLIVENMASTDIIALLPAGHPMARVGGTLPLAEFAPNPIILCEPRLGYGRSILEAFDQASLQPNIVADCDNVESLKYMVLAGAGLGILPRMAVTDVSPLWPQWVTRGLDDLVRSLLRDPGEAVPDIEPEAAAPKIAALTKKAR
jgi:DNA-binding transcriptional LysR family regulator